MTKVIKNEGKFIPAFKLGANSEMEIILIKIGMIKKTGEGYELYSQEAKNGSGQKAKVGDFFKVDNAGYPYPNEREWFYKNHKHVEGDIWEQLPKPLNAWESNEEITKEVQFLIDNKGLKLNPEDPDNYFGAELWGSYLTAAIDAVLIFYSISYNEDGTVADADFNFVARSEFEKTYHYVAN